ncbi:MAG: two-component system response regulator [Armatimonadetes bacterium CG_4_10_14_3_um_filter_66_18]|nr:response regulator [Armatimonadota bacterium]OIO96417.1 MAG: two-component system response regulator [Armatimonadetes bacterium CG2_30_66_41]PIU93277.1 MAG: two-component system response regulator [Armatimonadetes bacterium CG06_land_8_20_14_3_00_66_21]PIX38526.1 MAG: two-component system response regulator [Armatimonadetes bacterium CG_4_8_14_3_um_filter_66_20]PIY35275.1 MAG: two-component system response regulator [Armatimonadetes bacterium CG_4_10_14_3_um_filter_66_18]PIZ47512.1 MAG: two
MQGTALEILLVEDEPGHAELVKRNLRRHRVANELHHVEDGEQALDYLHQRGDFADPETNPRPHLVLLDLRLPKIDGIEVLQEIKAARSLQPIPVAVLTSSDAETDMAKACEAQANSYLVKPVDFDKFRQLIEDLGFCWLAWDRRSGDRDRLGA